jgi:hypothetical protein
MVAAQRVLVLALAATAPEARRGRRRRYRGAGYRRGERREAIKPEKRKRRPPRQRRGIGGHRPNRH